MSRETPANAPMPPGWRACYARGWRRALRRPLAAFGGIGLTLALAVGGLLLPWVNVVVLLAAFAPLVGAVPQIALALEDGRPLAWNAPLLGFRRYQRWLSLVWVSYLLAVFLTMPTLIGLWLGRRIVPHAVDTVAAAEQIAAILLALGALTSLTLLIAVLHPYVLVPLRAADAAPDVPVQRLIDDGVAALGEGAARRRTLAAAVALLLCGAIGLLAAGVGLLITLPPAACALAALYRARVPLDDAAPTAG